MSSGTNYELRIFSEYFRKKSESSYIEPRISLLNFATPSIIDFLAEIDLLVFDENQIRLIECKRRQITEYDLQKFYIYLKEANLPNNSLYFYTSESIDQDLLFQSQELGIEVVKSRGYDYDNELRLLWNYYLLANNNLPGFNYILNETWTCPISKAKRRTKIVIRTLQQSIPKLRLNSRKIAEFVFLKAIIINSILENKSRFFKTFDLINVILGVKNNLRISAEEKLGVPLIINKDLPPISKYREFYPVGYSEDSNDTFVLILGAEELEKYDIRRFVLKLIGKQSNKTVRLVHTEYPLSKSVANWMKNELPSLISTEISEANLQEGVSIASLLKEVDHKKATIICGYLPKNIIIEIFMDKTCEWNKFYMLERPSVPISLIRAYELSKWRFKSVRRS